MPVNNISNTINSHTRFVRETHDNNIGYGEKSIRYTLRRGVVVDINRWASGAGSDNVYKPPYAIAAVIPDEDLYNDRPDLMKKKVWYPPLSPLNNISMPEIGEEVFIIKEREERGSVGYWVGRVNNSNNLGYYPAKNWNKDETKFANGPIDIENIRKDAFIVPSRKTPYPPLPIFEGDVLQQGRQGTYLRHSNDPLTKRGILEMGIQFPTIKEPDFSQPTIGFTKTKTIHFEKMTLDRITGSYKLLPEKFIPYVSVGDLFLQEEFQTPFYKLPTEGKNSIVNIAENHYNLSVDDAGNSTDQYLYRQVLGDRNKETIEELLIIIKDLKDLVNTFYTEYKNHTHTIPRYVFRYGKYIGRKGGLVNIVFRQKDRQTKQIETNQDIYDMDLDIEKFDEEILALNQKLETTLSKTQFIQ